MVATVVPELTRPPLSYDQRRLRSYERDGQYRLGVAKRRPSSEASEASAALITVTFNVLLVAVRMHMSSYSIQMRTRKRKEKDSNEKTCTHNLFECELNGATCAYNSYMFKRAFRSHAKTGFP